MGVFDLQLRGPGGEVLTNVSLPNMLAREAMDTLYHRMFPPHGAAMNFKLALAGCTMRLSGDRPNPLAGTVEYDHDITFAQVAEDESEGGSYHDDLRASIGYARQPVAFTIGRNGEFHASSEAVFTNTWAWAPQSCDAWDDPNHCPPAWGNGWREDTGLAIGFPWYPPRRKTGTGEIGWLQGDYYKMQFPITGVALVDDVAEIAIAVARLPGPLYWWPGLSIHATYRGLFEDRQGRCTYAFVEKFAERAFGGTGTAPEFYARPVLAAAPAPSRSRAYADVAPHFVSGFGGVQITNWVYQDPGAGSAPPYLQTPNVSWNNGTGEEQGPFKWIAIYGAGDVLYMMVEIEPATIPDGDTLKLNQGIRFWLDLEL